MVPYVPCFYGNWVDSISFLLSIFIIIIMLLMCLVFNGINNWLHPIQFILIHILCIGKHRVFTIRSVCKWCLHSQLGASVQQFIWSFNFCIRWFYSFFFSSLRHSGRKKNLLSHWDCWLLSLFYFLFSYQMLPLPNLHTIYYMRHIFFLFRSAIWITKRCFQLFNLSQCYSEVKFNHLL